MAGERLTTERLELLPLPPAAAAALPGDRATAQRLIGARLPESWPQPDLLDALPIFAAEPDDGPPFGAWVIVERGSGEVVGDAGFLGPPADGVVEIGFSLVPERRGRGYATAAVRALLAWAHAQPGVEGVIARCDPGNGPSIRTLERSGFGPTGEVDGQLTWWSEPGPGGEAGGALP